MAGHPEQSSEDWLTLRQAAARTGLTKDAIRHRVRRRTLAFSKSNDGVVRVSARDLADLPPPDPTDAGQGQATTPATPPATDTTMADLTAALAGLGTSLERTLADLGRTMADLDDARTGQVASHGRAERAEAEAAAFKDRAEAAEARAAGVELALAEARTPWAVKVIRALRSRGA